MPAQPDPMRTLPTPATVKAPADRFTGDVWGDTVTAGTGPGTPTLATVRFAPGAPTLATVRFAPGARTAWHRHPNGQTLHVTDGLGLVQSRDGTAILMRRGDTVLTPPGVWHWHGAAPDMFVAHLALSAAGDVDWGEHVSDQEYADAISERSAG